MTDHRAYPAWIDEYARVFHASFTHMMPCHWGPVNVISLLEVLQGALLAQVARPLEVLKKQGISPRRMVEAFPSPSGFRIAFFYLLTEYASIEPKGERQDKLAREVFNTCVDMLRARCLEDIFVERKNIIHTKDERDQIVQSTPWQTGTTVTGRSLGRLYNALQSLTLALYTDFFPQDCQDMYGPYSIDWQSQPSLLTIKHFSKLRCEEVWPEMARLPFKDIKVFQIYQGIDIRCELIGGHTRYEGSPIEGLRAWAVMIDGRSVHDLKHLQVLEQELSRLAVEQFERLRSLSGQALVNKVLDLLCYQFKDLFALANMDWRPSEDMKERTKNLEPAYFDLSSLPPLPEYVHDPMFEVYWLKKLYEPHTN